MPVFSRVRDGGLVLTVYGDYTANELRRVSFAAFEAEDAPARLPVVLYLRGAAGLANKCPWIYPLLEAFSVPQLVPRDDPGEAPHRELKPRGNPPTLARLGAKVSEHVHVSTPQSSPL
jgi:hypothetical protein